MFDDAKRHDADLTLLGGPYEPRPARTTSDKDKRPDPGLLAAECKAAFAIMLDAAAERDRAIARYDRASAGLDQALDQLRQLAEEDSDDDE